MSRTRDATPPPDARISRRAIETLTKCCLFTSRRTLEARRGGGRRCGGVNVQRGFGNVAQGGRGALAGDARRAERGVHGGDTGEAIIGSCDDTECTIYIHKYEVSILPRMARRRR